MTAQTYKRIPSHIYAGRYRNTTEQLRAELGLKPPVKVDYSPSLFLIALFNPIEFLREIRLYIRDRMRRAHQ